MALGYSQPWGTDVVVVADLVREQQLAEDEEHNFFEAGLRYQPTPLTLVTGGAGIGFGDESPDFRAVVGFQHALTLFPLF